MNIVYGIRAFDGSETVLVTYIFQHAFTKCACGADLALAIVGFGSNTYTGYCSLCGCKSSLRDGKIATYHTRQMIGEQTEVLEVTTKLQ